MRDDAVVEDGSCHSCDVLSSENLAVPTLVELFLIDSLDYFDAAHDRIRLFLVNSVRQLFDYVIVFHLIDWIQISLYVIGFIFAE